MAGGRDNLNERMHLPRETSWEVEARLLSAGT